jgi:hypothetical protein
MTIREFNLLANSGKIDWMSNAIALDYYPMVIWRNKNNKTKNTCVLSSNQIRIVTQSRDANMDWLLLSEVLSLKKKYKHTNGTLVEFRTDLDSILQKYDTDVKESIFTNCTKDLLRAKLEFIQDKQIGRMVKNCSVAIDGLVKDLCDDNKKSK